MPKTPKISGMHIEFEYEGAKQFIKVKRSLMKSDKLVPKPRVLNGIRVSDKDIKLTKRGYLPVYRADIADRVTLMAAEAGFTPSMLFGGETTVEFKEEDLLKMKKDELRELCGKFDVDYKMRDTMKVLREKLLAKVGEVIDTVEVHKKWNMLIQAILKVSEQIPLQTYKQTNVDAEGNCHSAVEKFQVKDIKDGKPQLIPFPYLEATKVFPINHDNVVPTKFWNEMLREGDKEYEVYSEDDVGRIGLGEVMAAMNAWVFPEDHPKYIDYGPKPCEVMAVISGVNLTSNTTQQYITLIMPVRLVQSDGSYEFVFRMKCCQAPVKYLNTMPEPKPGETVKTIPQAQAPLVMADFADFVDELKARA